MNETGNETNRPPAHLSRETGPNDLIFRFPGGFTVAGARQLMSGSRPGPALITCRSGAGVYLADLDCQWRDARQWRHRIGDSLRGAFGRQLHLPVEVTIRAYDPRDTADLADVFLRPVR